MQYSLIFISAANESACYLQEKRKNAVIRAHDALAVWERTVDFAPGWSAFCFCDETDDECNLCREKHLLKCCFDFCFQGFQSKVG